MLAVPRTWLGLPLVVDNDNVYIAVARGPHADRRSIINMENRNSMKKKQKSNERKKKEIQQQKFNVRKLT